MTKRGQIYKIESRAKRGREMYYEVAKVGRGKDNQWLPLSQLKQMDAYVIKLVRNYDEVAKVFVVYFFLRLRPYPFITFLSSTSSPPPSFPLLHPPRRLLLAWISGR